MPQVLAALKPGGRLLVVDHDTTVGHGAKDSKTLIVLSCCLKKINLKYM